MTRFVKRVMLLILAALNWGVTALMGNCALHPPRQPSDYILFGLSLIVSVQLTAIITVILYDDWRGL